MTTEEYNIKIKELRKERDFHQKEASRLDKEMNELVNSIDKEKIDWMIAKYRERYSKKACEESTLYPGVEEMLKELITILIRTQVLTCQDLVGSNVGVQQAV